MKKTESFRFIASNLLENIAYGFCNTLEAAADRLDTFASNMEIDESILETIPTKYVEKKRNTAKPVERIPISCLVKSIELSEDIITVHAVLDGFDEEYLNIAKGKIIKATQFIISNTENVLERDLAAQLLRMFRKKAVVLCDAYLTEKEKYRAYFMSGHNQDKPQSNDFSYIGIDVMSVMRNDDASLINDIIHEAYHAWRYYKSNTEYSIIDETRAWNIALHFSNKYRAMHGITIVRENDYTVEEIKKIGEEYRNALNVNLRYGPGENIIEKIGYGIANLIDNAADSVNRLTDKMIKKI